MLLDILYNIEYLIHLV